MPASRGRRNPQLLEQRPEPSAAPSGYGRQFFCGRKPLTYLGDAYQPGDRMPDSVGQNIPRLDTRIRQGLIHVQYVPVEDGAPPPPPPIPDTRLAQAMAANVADPPASCEHDQEHIQVIEHDGQFLALCTVDGCGARHPVNADGSPLETAGVGAE